MVQFLVELDDDCARDLERVAPARKRMRAEFVRLAIRRAVDLALDQETAEAYAATTGPESTPGGTVLPADLVGWDPDNALAKRASSAKNASSARAGARRGTRATKRSAEPRPREPARKRDA